MDMSNSGQSFEVFFNGVKRFIIPVSQKSEWSIAGTEGGKLNFQALMLDRHGDAHGYMSMEVPSSWLNKGGKQEIKIAGDKSGSSTWIIIYEADDALDFLQESSGFSGTYRLNAELSGRNYELEIVSAAALAGKEFRIETGKYSSKGKLAIDQGFARARMIIPKSNLAGKISVFDDKGEILVWDFTKEGTHSSILMAEGV